MANTALVRYGSQYSKGIPPIFLLPKFSDIGIILSVFALAAIRVDASGRLNAALFGSVLRVSSLVLKQLLFRCRVRRGFARVLAHAIFYKDFLPALIASFELVDQRKWEINYMSVTCRSA